MAYIWGKPAGSIYQMYPEEVAQGDMSTMWIVYFAVNDCDTVLEEAKSLGGEVLNEPMDIEGIGRLAYLKYSQGAMFAIIKLIQQSD